MADFLYVIVKMIAVIHDMIMTWNDSFETVFSDKELHFLVIGFLGMGMLFVIYPLFKLLSENHVLVIAWIYVFTVIIVIVFASSPSCPKSPAYSHLGVSLESDRYKRRYFSFPSLPSSILTIVDFPHPGFAVTTANIWWSTT